MTTKLLRFAPALLALSLWGCSGGGSSSGSLTGTIIEYPTPTANSGPSDIVTGPDGKLWFLEGNTNTNKIGKSTTTGIITEYQLPTTNAFPTSIVSGPDGNLWYVDEDNNLGRVTTTGTIQLFSAPNAGELTVGPDNNLWVAEFNGGHIDVYSTAGTSLHSFASDTNPSNLQVEAITSGPGSDLWYDTFSGDNLIKMTTAGVATQITLSPQIQGTMRDLVEGPDGNIWLCATDENDIVRITPTGAVTLYPVPTAGAQPDAICVGPDNNLWFTEQLGDKIGRVITTTGAVSEYQIPTPASQPIAITAGPDGWLWFVENVSNKIGKIHP